MVVLFFFLIWANNCVESWGFFVVFLCGGGHYWTDVILATDPCIQDLSSWFLSEKDMERMIHVSKTSKK